MIIRIPRHRLAAEKPVTLAGLAGDLFKGQVEGSLGNEISTTVY